MSDLRGRIDALNGQILSLLQERAGIVLEIARVKQARGLEGHDPDREEQMLGRLTAEPTGPFGPAEIRAVFKAVFRASLAIQDGLAPAGGTLTGTLTGALKSQE